MLVGVPREIKNSEHRVGLTPAGVRELRARGHQVLIECNAGAQVGLEDQAYAGAGAEIVANASEIFSRSELIIKVKEPQPDECRLLREDQILFTFLHLAPDPEQTRLLLASGATCIAYETVTDRRGGLPLLTPMSEVAGRMAIQAAAHCLEKGQGGSGVLMGGVPGVAPARVLILGGGVVGLNAARIAMGMGADVSILDRSLPRLQYIDELYGDRLTTLYSTAETIEEHLPVADAVIGAVLLPGASAPKLVSREMLGLMQRGSVVVDVAIDQGGCFATSHPTTHQEPTFVVDGVVHYCVANMPGGVPRTATFALTNATLPHVVALADKSTQALLDDEHLLNGLNIHRGRITHPAVAEALGYTSVPPDQALRSPQQVR